MDDHVIATINKQAKEIQGIKFANINMKSTVNDYKDRGDDSDSGFEDDDKSYETSDDSTVDGNNDTPNKTNRVKLS